MNTLISHKPPGIFTKPIENLLHPEPCEQCHINQIIYNTICCNLQICGACFSQAVSETTDEHGHVVRHFKCPGCDTVTLLTPELNT